jgi:hypothetical protein
MLAAAEREAGEARLMRAAFDVITTAAAAGGDPTTEGERP